MKTLTISTANFVGRDDKQVAYLRVTLEGSRLNIGLTPAQARMLAAQAADLTAAADEAERLASPKPVEPTAPVTVDTNAVLAQLQDMDVGSVIAKLQSDPRFASIMQALAPAATAAKAPAAGSLATAVASRPKRRVKG